LFLNSQNVDGTSARLTDSQQTEINNNIIGPLQRVAQLPPRWQKLPNSKCKIPTELLLSLNTSERGCSSTRFSHNGYFLACAEVNKSQENNLISIFEVNQFIFEIFSFIKNIILYRFHVVNV